MTEIVVYRFEGIKVDKQEGERLAFSLSCRSLVFCCEIFNSTF